MDKHQLREDIRFQLGQQIAYDDKIFEWFIRNNEKIEQLQAERDMLEDLVGEKQEEFTEYKRVFKTDYELQAENERLKANQFPSEPICGRCGEPRKLLGVLYETHFHSERITP